MESQPGLLAELGGEAALLPAQRTSGGKKHRHLAELFPGMRYREAEHLPGHSVAEGASGQVAMATPPGSDSRALTWLAPVAPARASAKRGSTAVFDASAARLRLNLASASYGSARRP